MRDINHTNRSKSSRLAAAASQQVKEKEYWVNKLSGQLVKSGFPYDFPRGEASGTLEERTLLAAVTFEFPGDTFSKLIKLSKGADQALNALLVTGLVVLLHQYTGSRDIILGTPIYKQDIEADIINTALVLRNPVKPGITFKQLLLQVAQTITEATENYGYPIEKLPGILNLEPLNQEFPLFEVAILLENIHEKKDIQHLKPIITFSFSRNRDGVEGVVEYRESLYREATITRICRHFTYLLDQALADIELPAAALEILSQEEKQQLLVHLNNTAMEYPREKILQQLFEEQVEQTPDHTALVGVQVSHKFYMSHLSYKELNKTSNQLAHLLRSKGVRANTIVGIMVERSIEMFIGIWGILKAGGAYLPIDPGTPKNRLISILEDSDIFMLLTSSAALDNYPVTALKGLGFTGASSLSPLVTAPRPYIDNLDSLPIPDRSLIDVEKYNRYIGLTMAGDCITLQATRGCPFHCAYCSKLWHKKHIVRSAENIFAEIRFYYDLGVRRFAFIDDIFNFNRKNSTRFFEMLIKHGLEVQLFFSAGMRGDLLSKDYIDLMVQAGTVNVALALESASPRIQQMIKKNLNLEKLQENIEYFCTKYPQVIMELFTMHGFPGETEEEAMMTLDFIKGIKWLHFPYVHILKIYPNTFMEKLALEHGISRQAIARSMDLAYHELPETLPFKKSFTLKYQAKFLNEYFFLKERLVQVLPKQTEVLTGDEIIQKYNNYLPTEIRNFQDLKEALGIKQEELKIKPGLSEDAFRVPGINQKIKSRFPIKTSGENALKILLLDLSQLFAGESSSHYDPVEQPLGLMYLMTALSREFGSKVKGKIAKSFIDFNSYKTLKTLLEEFQADIIGIRTLTYYRDFFHKTVEMIRQWGINVPIVTGGPYASSDYKTLLQDSNIDIVVLGEGELTFCRIVETILENNKKLPAESVLKEIPGIAFVPRREKEKLKSSRQILLLDIMAESQPNRSGENPGYLNKPSDLTYVMFTSGSTGKPNGVMVEHRNVTNLVSGLKERIYRDYEKNLKVGLVAPYIFDASVQQIFAVFLLGHALYIVPEDTRIEGSQLLQFYQKYRIDISDGAPTHIHLLAEGESVSDHSGEWAMKHLIIGGEALPRKTVGNFFRRFKTKELKITNVYGPTECCVDSTSYQISGETPGTPAGTVPIGIPMPNEQVYIVNPENKLTPFGVPGELCIGGDGVSRGYLNNPELTAQKFLPAFNRSYRSYMSYNSKNIYKTGDLARWMPDGQIEFLGRVDRQVKIRGFRIELAEIEKQLQALAGVKEAVVVLKELSNPGAAAAAEENKHICAYIIAAAEIDSTELRKKLADHLPIYMIPSYFIQLEKFPLTPNGKVNRKMLPQPKIETQSQYKAARDKLEEKIIEIWAGLLGVDQEIIGIDTNFFELGGHSLKAVLLITKIHKELNVKLTLADIFRVPTVKGISGLVKESTRARFEAIEPAEHKDYYVLSSAQKRLYILQQIAPGSTAYNIPQAVILEGEVSKEKFEILFKRLIERHEILRTSFLMIAGEPVQRIHEQVEFGIEYYDSGREGERERGNLLKNSGIQAGREIGSEEDLSNTDSLPSKHSPKTPLSLSPSLPELFKVFIRPFDLSQAPLLRVGLAKLEERKHLLVADMHHIISDGVSHQVLVQDFTALHQGKTLPALILQYKDYAQWQNSYEERKQMKQQEEYWLRAFAGEIPVLHLPTDYPRPPVQGYEGDTLGFEIGRNETAALNKVALDQGVTLYMVVLAIFNIFLSKLSRQDDIVIGTPIAGRRHADLEQIIGVFVNTLALRNYPTPGKVFLAFLQEVKETTLTAFENQEYQFEDLVEKLAVSRDTSRNPLIDVEFAFNNIETQPGKPDQLSTPALRLMPYPLKSKTAKFDLSLLVLEGDGKLLSTFEYCTRLFKEETIQRMIKYFKQVVYSILQDPRQRIGDMEILYAEERKLLLYDFNNNEGDFPRHKTIYQFIETYAKRTPDRIALVGPDPVESRTPVTMFLSYRELSQRAQRLAAYLRHVGVGKDQPVAILLERSSWMIEGILAAWKAGGAYLPLDTQYPQQRIVGILRDSRTPVLLTQSGYVEPDLESTYEGQIIRLDNCPPALIANTSPPFHEEVDMNSLAYVIYTSGSTGAPKGVMIEHIGMMNHIQAKINDLQITGETIVAQNASHTFDISVWQFFAALTRGGKTIIYPDELILEPTAFIARAAADGVTILEVVPSYLAVVLDELAKHHGLAHQVSLPLAYLLVTGEEVKPALVKKWFSLYPGIKMVNAYGPTEASDDITHYIMDKPPASERIPIGKPLLNFNIYIVDENMKLCPLGVSGEICVSGIGVGRGYLGDEKKTKEVFRDDPFAKTKRRLYKTGDLGCWLPDGTIDFLGRKDSQVKIRGFRIELGEIECKLMQHPAVKEAVVIDREDKEANKYLCAYLVTNGKDGHPEIKQFLSERLPEYMVPGYFLELERMPLTRTGKIDRKALPAPGKDPAEYPAHRETGEYTPPQTNTEKTIAGVWQEMLKRDHVSIHDNFFDLGGNSLSVIKVIGKLKEVLNRDIPVIKMFRYPTIYSLSEYLQQEDAGQRAPQKPIGQSVDQMEETMQLLIGE